MKTVVVLTYENTTPRELGRTIECIIEEKQPHEIHLAVDGTADAVLNALSEARARAVGQVGDAHGGAPALDGVAEAPLD